MGNQFFWLEVATVMSKSPMVWQVTIKELHVMWDYEGELESTCWSKAQGSKVLYHIIQSPPAKMIRVFLSKAADAIVDKCHGDRIKAIYQIISYGSHGRTW